MRYDRLKRREFITLLGGVAAAWPLVARAQQRSVPVIGFLGATTPSLQKEWTLAFVRRLAEHGWIEGRTIAIEYRWGQARPELLSSHLDELVLRKVDVIVTHPDETVLIAKQKTATIPIVFPIARDPIETGIVSSLARPNGNATGLSLQRIDTVAKRVGLLREIVPTLRRLGILYNRTRPSEMEQVDSAARELDLEVVKEAFGQGADIAPAFKSFTQRVDALYVVSEPLAYVNRMEISTRALAAKLPTVYSVREYVKEGGLASYGPNFADLFRRSADFVDKILRGARPSDIPVEQPIKFDLIVNLITAKALGLEIPPTLLALADEVIEETSRP
jgi:putative ABC transport system substrate-binding protein